jgi:hypothetical protein
MDQSYHYFMAALQPCHSLLIEPEKGVIHFWSRSETSNILAKLAWISCSILSASLCELAGALVAQQMKF